MFTRDFLTSYSHVHPLAPVHTRVQIIIESIQKDITHFPPPSDFKGIYVTYNTSIFYALNI